VTIEPEIVHGEIERLRERYKGIPLEPVIWERDGQKRSPYRALIVMGLSTRISDERGLDVWKELLDKYPSPDDLKQGWQKDGQRVRKILHPLGDSAQRERIIKAAVKFGTEIPSEVDQLITHPGIGPTIAEKIVGYGFGKPALPLDSHGCQIIARVCGLNGSLSKDHRYLRGKLKDILDPSEWMEVHELLRLHGQSSGSTPETVINSWEKWRALLVEDY